MDEEDYPILSGFQRKSVYIMMLGGELIMFIGVWMTATNTSTFGTHPKFGGGKEVDLSGSAMIGIGLFFFVFPLFTWWKELFRGRRW